jgi:phosphonate transport system substrate-binding protein
MDTIVIASLMSDNARAFHAGVADYLGRRVGIRTSFVTDVDWQERERMLDDGRAQVGVICGLPYTRKTGWLELLGAPVMRAPRYGEQPVYFSDVVVRRDSSYQSFADLRGAVWAYNEPNSLSGCAVLGAHLARLGETASFCGRVVESGAHLRSLELILEGAIDAAAIDSTVLETELAWRPDLHGQIRVVEQLGPSPIPPVVARRDLPDTLKHELRDALLQMHEDEQGAVILRGGLAARFVPVRDADYDDIREKARLAEHVRLEQGSLPATKAPRH